MPRSLALLSVLLVIPFLLAADPTPVEKQLALQKAMVTARQFLDVNMPAEAVAALEAEIANADGNKTFLTLLREAYLADLFRQEKAAAPDATRIAQLRRHLALLGETAAVPPAPASAPPPPRRLARRRRPTAWSLAVELFKKNQYAQADKAFAQIGADKLTADQKTAWAYCRVKGAADKLNAGGCRSRGGRRPPGGRGRRAQTRPATRRFAEGRPAGHRDCHAEGEGCGEPFASIRE